MLCGVRRTSVRRHEPGVGGRWSCRWAAGRRGAERHSLQALRGVGRSDQGHLPALRPSHAAVAGRFAAATAARAWAHRSRSNWPTATVLALLIGHFGGQPEILALGFFGALGVALAAIDISVQRLPDHLTLPAYPILIALLAIAAFTSHDVAALGRALLGGLALSGTFLLLSARATRAARRRGYQAGRRSRVSRSAGSGGRPSSPGRPWASCCLPS